MKTINGLIGSKNYASIMAHNRVELSRRDDLESLGYMLIYFYLGFLPWKNEPDEKTIIKLKDEILSDVRYPKVLLDFLKYSRMIEYEEKPNYYLIIDNFKKEIEILSKNS